MWPLAAFAGLRISNGGFVDDRANIPGLDFLDCDGSNEWYEFRQAVADNFARGSPRSLTLHAWASRLLEQANAEGALCQQPCTSTTHFSDAWLRPWARACADSPKFSEYVDAHYPAWARAKHEHEANGAAANYGASLATECPYGLIAALIVAARHEWPATEAVRYLYMVNHMLGWMLAFDSLDSTAWGREAGVDAVAALSSLARPTDEFRLLDRATLLDMTWSRGDFAVSRACQVPPSAHSAPISCPASMKLGGAGCAGTRLTSLVTTNRVTLWLTDAHASQSGEIKHMFARFVTDVNFTFLGNSLAYPQCNNYGLCADLSAGTTHLLRRFKANLGAVDEFAAEFRELHWPALRDRLNVDVFVCSVPVAFCGLFLGLERPVLGYLALPPLHGLPPGEAQRKWLSDFRELLVDGRNVFACFNTYLASAIEWQLGSPRLPVVRLFGFHAQAAHLPIRADEVLIARHGKAHLLQECLLSRFTEATVYPFRFVHFSDLLHGTDSGHRYNATLSFRALAAYRAVVFFPEDVTLVMFYEMYTACIPIFVHRYFWLHSNGQTTLSLSEGDREWRPAQAAAGRPSPFTARYFEDTSGPYVHDVYASAYWSRYSDFALFPHIVRFVGIPELLHLLRSTDLQGVAAQMRAFNAKEISEAAEFWRYSVARLVSSTSSVGVDT